MFLNTFPIEVIEKITKSIEEDNDLNSLYNLCLTNRTLCQITMPYLWKKSLNIKKFRGYHSTVFKNSTQIISTLLSFIKNTNIKHFLKKYYRYHHYIPLNPIFNYPSFVKQIDFTLFFNLLGYWTNPNGEFHEDEDSWDYFVQSCGKSIYYTSSGRTIALAEIIFRTIIKNTDGLEVIHVAIDDIDDEYDVPDEFYESLFKLEDSQRCLKKLRKFVFKERVNEISLIDQIINSAHNLTKISIQLYEYSDSIIINLRMLILTRCKNLKEIKIDGMNHCEDTFGNLQVTISPSLESLKLIGCDVSDDFLRFFINCNKLRKLELLNVDFILSNKILQEIIFPDLEELKITDLFFHDEREENSIKQFFMQHIKNLKKLETYQSDKEFNSSEEFILNIPLLIYESNCSNLTHLSLQIYYDSQMTFIPFILKNSKYIEELVLFGGFRNILFNNYLEDILLSCNKNLKILDIKEWRISISGLKILLTQEKLYLKRLNCFIYNGNSYHVERLIQKYIKFNNRMISNYTKKDPLKDYYGKEEYCVGYRVTIEWALD